MSMRKLQLGKTIVVSSPVDVPSHCLIELQGLPEVLGRGEHLHVARNRCVHRNLLMEQTRFGYTSTESRIFPPKLQTYLLT